MKLKRMFLSAMLALTLIVSMLAGCGQGSDSAAKDTSDASGAGSKAAGKGSIELVCATTGTAGASELHYLEEFGRLVEERSGGSLKVSVFADGQLGGDVDTTESLLNGEIAAVTLQPSAVVTFVPAFAAFDYPNLFSGYSKEQIHGALSGDFFSLIQAASEKSGLKTLSFAQGASFREMSVNKEIRSVADFKGIKIRTLENPNHMAYWKALGATPTPLAWSEVYLSLQQGVVDAQENGYEVVLNSTLYEVQDYIINTDHILMVNVLLFSPAVYDALTAEQQKIVDEAAWEAASIANDKMETANIELRKELEEKGVTVVDLDDAVIEDMRGLTTGVYDSITAGIGGEYLDAIETGLKAS